MILVDTSVIVDYLRTRDNRLWVTVAATVDRSAAALGIATGWVQAAALAPRCAAAEAGSGWLACRPGW